MNNQKIIIRMGQIAIWLFFILEFTTEFVFGSMFPGYNWKTESISYLGQRGSPVEQWVMLWGIISTLLIAIFVYSFYETFQSVKWVKLASFSLLVYGIGEGIGSGCFPIDPVGSVLTMSGRLHNILGGIGDTGIVLLPFILMAMFPRRTHRKLHVYLWVVVVIGFLMSGFFLVAKYEQPNNFILDYKGVWQRIYTFNYYVMLLVMGAKMNRSDNKNPG